MGDEGKVVIEHKAIAPACAVSHVAVSTEVSHRGQCDRRKRSRG